MGHQKKDTEWVLWGVPKELRIKFKTKCASQGKTMKEVFIQILEKYTKDV